jgi:hypothetical protein
MMGVSALSLLVNRQSSRVDGRSMGTPTPNKHIDPRAQILDAILEDGSSNGVLTSQFWAGIAASRATFDFMHHDARVPGNVASKLGLPKTATFADARRVVRKRGREMVEGFGRGL